MENIVAKNIKDLFQIYFVLKIYLWTINIFLYRMKDDLMQIYFEREYYIFDAGVLVVCCLEDEEGDVSNETHPSQFYYYKVQTSFTLLNFYYCYQTNSVPFCSIK